MRQEGTERAYFAASNSKDGFHSYYREVFDRPEIDRVFIVKGGPGTGKSRFLRDVAEAGEAHGYGTEYIYCSSDPLSLDGIILRGDVTTAFLDGTAPHSVEPTAVGARENLIDLGVFWDSRRLMAEAEAIAEWDRQKKNAYGRAYRYLAGAGEVTENRDALLSPLVRTDRMRRHLCKRFAELPEGSGFSSCPALLHAVGMRGRASLSGFFGQAKERYFVEDCHGAAGLYLREIGNLAMEKRWKIRVSYHPLMPNCPDAIYLSDLQIGFLACKPSDLPEGAKVIRVRRFLDPKGLKAVHREILFDERMAEALTDEALAALDEAGRAHFRLEEIYKAAMDFEAKENFTKEFCRRFFDLQTE